MLIASFDISHKKYYDICLSIRTQVFVVEQQVPVHLECDEYENCSQYFLGFLEHTPVATARIRQTTLGIKLERFASLPEYRNKGLGKELMQHIVHYVTVIHPGKILYLHSQISAVGFYTKMGFETVGEMFIEASIPHYVMKISSHG
ncbi:MAG: GNAT family N-acetyltransferase [Bacteroidales bacterium]|nr:GNAT family N-acetyltransferase [Bacteroidales bacterium]